jgi:CheY-like chemotaxis protein
VISDLRMPGIDGWKLYAWIKRHRPHMAGKLVFITGDIINADAQLFFQETGVLHLKKPFHLGDLQRIVRTFARRA